MKNKKEFVVIGMGQFGMSVARTLASSGAIVMAIDKDEKVLEQIANDVTHTICADLTNMEVMKQLGISNYDGAIVGMGNDLETNVLITIQLKEMKVPFIMSKATTELEGRILRKVGADRIIFPDKEMGYRIGNQIMHGNYFEAVELSDRYSIVDVDVPAGWVGKTLRELNVRARHGVSIIGIRGLEETNINPEPDYRLVEGDLLIVLGHNTDLNKLREM